MNKVKCINGHFYDADRFEICPICGADSTASAPKESKPKAPETLPNTKPLISAEDAQEISSAPSSLIKDLEKTGSQNISPLPKTTAYYNMGEVNPPVGWLICVNGFYQGQAFQCKTGKNRIGRNQELEICLSEDVSITRDPHAILIYDPKNKRFYLQAGTSDGLAYWNGNLLFGHEELQPYDKISLGNSEFIFLPLCGDQFTWDEYIVKG